MRFPNQEYWGGLPFPSPGDLPDPGIEPVAQISCISRQVLYHWHHLGSTPNWSLDLILRDSDSGKQTRDWASWQSSIMFLILSQVWETSNKWLKCLSSLEFHNPFKSQSGLRVSNDDSENSMGLKETGISYKSPYYSLVKICHKMTSFLGNQWHCVGVCTRMCAH